MNKYIIVFFFSTGTWTKSCDNWVIYFYYLIITEVGRSSRWRAGRDENTHTCAPEVFAESRRLGFWRASSATAFAGVPTRRRKRGNGYDRYGRRYQPRQNTPTSVIFGEEPTDFSAAVVASFLRCARHISVYTRVQLPSSSSLWRKLSSWFSMYTYVRDSSATARWQGQRLTCFVVFAHRQWFSRSWTRNQTNYMSDYIRSKNDWVSVSIGDLYLCNSIHGATRSIYP